MIGFKRILVVAVTATLFAAAAWGDPARLVSIPISGEYWEPAAEGMLVYAGTVTLDWQSVGSGTGWFVKATLVAQAWCRNTGAGYTLYGLSSDRLDGEKGAMAELVKSILAVDGSGKPAFENQVRVAVSLGDLALPPTVTVIAFAGR